MRVSLVIIIALGSVLNACAQKSNYSKDLQFILSPSFSVGKLKNSVYAPGRYGIVLDDIDDFFVMRFGVGVGLSYKRKAELEISFEKDPSYFGSGSRKIRRYFLLNSRLMFSCLTRNNVRITVGPNYDQSVYFERLYSSIDKPVIPVTSNGVGLGIGLERQSWRIHASYVKFLESRHEFASSNYSIPQNFLNIRLSLDLVRLFQNIK